MESPEEKNEPPIKNEENTEIQTVENIDSSLLQKATPEYLQELLRDKKLLQSMPNTFKHVELILEKEITLVRERLFHKNGSIQKAASELPEPSGPIVTLQKKVFVPVKENPNYNFVGRLLGPRGLTAKQMEQDLGCKIMVRGKGSMRDKRKEDQNRGKPNWEHLQEELHVLVSVEDYESRAEARLQRAVNAIQIFLEQGVKTPEDKDVLKQTQLMELAVLNDKDRKQAQVQQMTQQQQQQLLLQHQYMTLFGNPSALAAAAASQNPHLLRLQAAAANSLGGLGPSSLLLQNSVMPAAAAAACMVPAAAAAAAVAAAAAPPSGNTGGNASNTNPLTLQQIQQSAILQSAAAASSLADPLAAFLNSFGPETSSGQLNFTSTPSGALSFLSANSPSMAAVAAAVTAANRDMQHSNMLGEYTQSGNIDGNAGTLKLKPNSVASVRMHPYLR